MSVRAMSPAPEDPADPPVLRLHTLDLAGLLLPQNGAPAAASRLTAAQRAVVRLALTTHGAMQLALPEHHRRVISAAHDAAGFLFAQPPDVKRRLCAAAPAGFLRGYIPPGGESGSAGVRELKEGFSFGGGRDSEEEEEEEEEEKEREEQGEDRRPAPNPLRQPNVWPAAAPGSDSFRRRAAEAHAALCEISKAVVSVVGEVFFEESGSDFVERFGSDEGCAISLARMFRYFADDGEPPGRENGAEHKTGSAEHTDWGFLTLVAERASDRQRSGGLQIFAAPSSAAPQAWHSVRAEPGSLILHAGDYLSLLSGGTIRSPLHRVTPPAGFAADGRSSSSSSSREPAERFSIVFFWYPAYHATFPPLASPAGAKLSLLEDQRELSSADGCGGAEGTRRAVEKLREVSFGDFICEKWTQVSRAG